MTAAGTMETTQKREQNRLAFTPFALKRLPIPKPQPTPDGKSRLVQTDFWDNSTPGFGIRLTSYGTRLSVDLYGAPARSIESEAVHDWQSQRARR